MECQVTHLGRCSQCAKGKNACSVCPRRLKDGLPFKRQEAGMKAMEWQRWVRSLKEASEPFPEVAVWDEETERFIQNLSTWDGVADRVHQSLVDWVKVRSQAIARGEKRPGPPKAPGGQHKEGESGELPKAVPKKAGAKTKAGASRLQIEKVTQAGASVS